MHCSCLMNNARGAGSKKKGKRKSNNLNPNAYLIKLVNPQMQSSCDGEEGEEFKTNLVRVFK